MAVLMRFKTKSGKQGSCDARCYDAKGLECSCCCGGVNHGVGFKQAYENTWTRFDEIVKEADDFKQIIRVSNQLSLPEPEERHVLPQSREPKKKKESYAGSDGEIPF